MNGEPMPPQAPGAAPAAPEDAGGASKLVVDIQDKMASLMDLLAKAPGIDPADKEQFGQIMGAYQDFIENNLGAAPGAKPQTKQGPSAPGGVPMEAGSREVMPAM